MDIAGVALAHPCAVPVGVVVAAAPLVEPLELPASSPTVPGPVLLPPALFPPELPPLPAVPPPPVTAAPGTAAELAEKPAR